MPSQADTRAVIGTRERPSAEMERILAAIHEHVAASCPRCKVQARWTGSAPPREPLCVCDAYGGCPQGCPECRVCWGDDDVTFPADPNPAGGLDTWDF